MIITKYKMNKLNENDRMVDPISKEILQIDDRLLLRETWIETPEIAHDLLMKLSKSSVQTPLTTLATKYLEMIGDIKIKKSLLPVSEIVLVLGHALNENGSASDNLLGRLEIAKLKYQKNPKIKILVSGGGNNKYFSESQVMKNWLMLNNVKENAIIIEDKSKDTVDNMFFSMEILKKYNPKSICLITCSHHMERSFLLLEQYIKHQNLNIDLTSTENKNVKEKKEVNNMERFVLFKDLGRILGIWEYKGYNIDSTIQSNKEKNKNIPKI